MINYNLGDIPAWIQAITASVAAVALLKTLRLQQKTSEDQKELLRLEMEKGRREIMPIFKTSRAIPKDSMGKFEIPIILLQNTAIEVVFSPGDDNGTATFSNTRTHNMEQNYTATCYYELRNFVHHEVKEVCNVDFRDLDGRRYNQKLFRHFEEFYFSPPTLLH